MNEIVARPELVELRTTDSQVEVEHDEFHGLWRHSLSAKAIKVSVQADIKFWYIEPQR